MQWIENPRVGGSIPPPGTTKSKKSNKISRHTLVDVRVFYPKFVLKVKECVTSV